MNTNGVSPSYFDHLRDLLSDCDGKRLVKHGKETVCGPRVVLVPLLLERWDCDAGWESFSDRLFAFKRTPCLIIVLSLLSDVLLSK